MQARAQRAEMARAGPHRRRTFRGAGLGADAARQSTEQSRWLTFSEPQVGGRLEWDGNEVTLSLSNSGLGTTHSVRQRGNAEWLRLLKDAGPSGCQAQRELRAVLVKGLHRGLSKWPDASSLVEDFAQDSLLRILDALDQFRDESRFLTWALAIAMRVAFSTLRRKHWRDVSFDSLGDVSSSGRSQAFEQAGEPEASESNPERLSERRQIFTILERSVAESLTERQREVVLAEIRGMPQAELAARLGTNRNALYKLCHDARRTLRRALEEAGFSADVVREAFR